jgi:hypothetical protein
MKTVSAKVTEEEYNKIKSLADNNNISISALIKQALFSAEIADPQPLENLNIQVRKIGNNLNQIAKYVNTKKRYNKTAESGLEEVFLDMKDLLYGK